MAIKKITRTIQWYGLLRFPDLGQDERVHWWRLIADMRRRPSGEYRNDGIWQPPRGFWGNVCLRKDGRVIRTAQLEFRFQIAMFESYTEAYLHQALSCQLDATLKSIENLGVQLQLPVISRINPIRDWQPYSLLPSDFSIKMISENAIAVFTLEYDIIPICAVDMSAVSNPPPAPEPPPGGQVLPPEGGPDIAISEAYDGLTDDGETYNPSPQPDEWEFPIGSDCRVYEIRGLYKIIGQDPLELGTEVVGFFYAPIESIRVEKFEEEDQTNSVVVTSAGRIDIQNCQPGQRSTLVANNIESFTIVSIQEVSNGGQS